MVYKAYRLLHQNLFLALGMDPPKEVTVSYVTEDSVTISWNKPLAPFDYYKMSYQSVKGGTQTCPLRDKTC